MLTRLEALLHLRRDLAELRIVDDTHADHPMFIKWREHAVEDVNAIFSERSEDAKRFTGIGFSFRTQSQEFPHILFQKGVARARMVLCNLHTLAETEETAGIMEPDMEEQSGLAPVKGKRFYLFIGTDIAISTSVLRTVRGFGWEPIALAGSGLTEEPVQARMQGYGGAQVALVLCSPEKGTDGVAQLLSPRERSRTIFDLGTLVGILGEGRVVFLHEGSCPIPSDLCGIQYIRMAVQGEWQEELRAALSAIGLETESAPAQELKAA